MKNFLLIIVTGAIIFCKMEKDPEKINAGQLNYELVNGWPELSKDYKIGQPTGIGIDRNNHIFVFHRAGREWTATFPDSYISENTILELDGESGKIINAWGRDYFIMPHGLTIDKDNNVWVTDVGLHQIFKFSHEGKLLMKLGVPKIPGNDTTHFNLPTDVAVALDGSIYVSDGYGNSRVIKFSSTGKYINEWGSKGKKPGQFNIPHGIAIDQNNIIYVADRQNNRAQVFDSSGNFLKELKNNEQVDQIPSIAIDNANRVFAIDYNLNKKQSPEKGSTIFEFDSTQQARNHFGATGLAERTDSWFHDIEIDSKGNIYVGDITNLKVLKFRPKKTVNLPLPAGRR